MPISRLTKEECRPGNRGCKPHGLDLNGNPLGILCKGKDCGGWICSNPNHYEIWLIPKKGQQIPQSFCRVCIATKNLPKSVIKCLNSPQKPQKKSLMKGMPPTKVKVGNKPAGE